MAISSPAEYNKLWGNFWSTTALSTIPRFTGKSLNGVTPLKCWQQHCWTQALCLPCNCVPNTSIKGQMDTLLMQEAQGDHRDTGSDSAPSWGTGRLWEVVIMRVISSAWGAPEIDLVRTHLYLDINSSLECQLSTQVINPSWDRFRFNFLNCFLKAARRWESLQSVCLLGMALAVPWQVLACHEQRQRGMHITGTSTPHLIPQQFCTVVAEKILICKNCTRGTKVLQRDTESNGRMWLLFAIYSQSAFGTVTFKRKDLSLVPAFWRRRLHHCESVSNGS